jgi:hypothetical protein
MTGNLRTDDLRGVRQRLMEELRMLDELGEIAACIEINSAIEILTSRLKEVTSERALSELEKIIFPD